MVVFSFFHNNCISAMKRTIYSLLSDIFPVPLIYTLTVPKISHIRYPASLFHFQILYLTFFASVDFLHIPHHTHWLSGWIVCVNCLVSDLRYVYVFFQLFVVVSYNSSILFLLFGNLFFSKELFGLSLIFPAIPDTIYDSFPCYHWNPCIIRLIYNPVR